MYCAVAQRLRLFPRVSEMQGLMQGAVRASRCSRPVLSSAHSCLGCKRCFTCFSLATRGHFNTKIQSSQDKAQAPRQPGLCKNPTSRSLLQGAYLQASHLAAWLQDTLPRRAPCGTLNKGCAHVCGCAHIGGPSSPRLKVQRLSQEHPPVGASFILIFPSPHHPQGQGARWRGLPSTETACSALPELVARGNSCNACSILGAPVPLSHPRTLGWKPAHLAYVYMEGAAHDSHVLIPALAGSAQDLK